MILLVHYQVFLDVSLKLSDGRAFILTFFSKRSSSEIVVFSRSLPSSVFLSYLIILSTSSFHFLILQKICKILKTIKMDIIKIILNHISQKECFMFGVQKANICIQSHACTHNYIHTYVYNT